MDHTLNKRVISYALFTLLLFTTTAQAKQVSVNDRTGAMQTVTLVTPSEITWSAGPKSLPAGAKFIVLASDPKKPGVFAMRLKLPANYQIPAHHHLTTENVTVISGTVSFGLGNKLDKTKSTAYTTGSFVSIPPRVNHFAWTGDSEAILQLNNMGPWEIIYVDPATDPRKPQKS